MANKLPLISIVMPTWNSMRYLEDCMYSLLQQTYSNFELLVCDGGSTDGTLQYFESLQDERIKIVSRKDSGLVNSLNIGFSHAKGDILCWLNSDDVYLRNDTLSRVANVFIGEKVQFVAGGAAMLSENGMVQRYLVPWFTRTPFTYSGYSNLFTGSLFFSRSTWSSFGCFSEKNKLAFEYELVKFLMTHVVSKKILGGIALAGFRLRPDSVSGANALALFEERKSIFGHAVHDNAPLVHRCVRAYSHLLSGQLLDVLNCRQANKALPTAWREIYVR